jgi:hypothetical protein
MRVLTSLKLTGSKKSSARTRDVCVNVDQSHRVLQCSLAGSYPKLMTTPFRIFRHFVESRMKRTNIKMSERANENAQMSMKSSS